MADVTHVPSHASLVRRVAELEREVASLRAKARKYDTLLSAFPQGISVSDAAGTIVETNPVAERLLGIDRREHEQRDVDGPEWQIVDSDGDGLPPERWASVVALNERRAVFNQEMGVLRPDGALTWLNVSAAPLPAEDGGVVITYNDVTERKQAAETLLLYESIVASSSEPMAVIDRDYRFQLVNRSYEKFWSLSREDIVGKTVAEVMGPETFARVAQPNVDRCLAGDVVRYGAWFESPRLGRRYMELNYYPRRDGRGEIVGLINLSYDLTDLKRSEDDLRRKESMLARTEAIAHLGSWQWEVATDQVTWSDELFRLFGRDPARGAPSYADQSSLHPPEDMARLDGLVRRAVEHAEPFELELGIVREDGSVRRGHSRGFPVCGPSGRVERLHGFLQDITERREAQLELERLAHDQSVILDHVPAYIYFKDTENNILGISKSVATATGLPVEEIVGRHSSEIYPETADRYWVDDLEVIRSGEPKVGIVEPLPVAGGERRWLLTDKIPYRDDAGRVSGVIVMASDITDRVLAEERLRASEALFHSLFEYAADAVYLLDFDGRFLDVNLAAERQTGFSRDELLAMKVSDLDPRSLAEDDRHAIWETIRDGETVSVQTTHRRKDGSTFPAEVNISVLEVGGERTILGFVRDVTDKTRMLEELRRSEERLSLALQGANDGLWDWNLETDEVFYSPRWKGMLGYADHEVENHFREWERLVAPEDRPRAWQALEAYLQGARPAFECEFRMLHKDGHWVDVLSRAFAIRRESDDRPVRVIGTHVDVTERNEMQRRLEQAQRLESIGNLAGGIAHDFNNLLYPIMGLTELLLDDLSPGSRDHENAREIHAAARRGRELVKRILAFSRESRGEAQPLRLQKIVEEVIEMARATIPASITIESRVAADCGVVMADATQIHQVLMNLITNAYHAIEPSEGRIDLELEERDVPADEAAVLHVAPGRYARLRVSDTGVGIDAEHLDKIFEPYFTTKTPEKGTGFGLSTAYGIIRDHEGAIAVRSVPGQGSTFDVYVPLMAAAPVTEQPAAARASQGGDERILLVDDEETIADLEHHMLRRLGYEVTALTSSRELLATFAKDPLAYDLVITDMTMPGMTGDKLAGELLALRQDIPIIVCTGYSERIGEENAEEFGVRGVLLKPVSRDELARKVREVLDHARRA
jgi:PAS domain S-box-containing protein